MDSFTHIALGATIGGALLGKKLGRAALGWGILFHSLPDIDVVIMPFVDTRWDLYLHRGPTHSILFITLVSWLLAKPLAKRWKKAKLSARQAGGFVFACLALHLLTDCFTVYGTQIWWPISSYPVSLDNLFIIAPLFTVPLLVALIKGLLTSREKWKKGIGVKASWVCLSISGAYVGLSFGAQYFVNQAFVKDLGQRNISWQRKMVANTPFNIVLWRAVVEREEEFWIGYRSLFDGRAPIAWTIFPKEKNTLEQWSDRKELRELRRFSKDWCLARETNQGVWLVDLRFGEFRNWDERGVALRPIFAWELRRQSRDDPMKNTSPGERNVGQTLKQIWFRIWNPNAEWDEKPRLIGNPSRSQEYLGLVK